MKPIYILSLLLLSTLCKPALAELEFGWNVGDKVYDFSAIHFDSQSASFATTSWYGEQGADVYIISTCAMWCGPCQQFGADAGSLVQTLAADGIDAKAYDFIFEDIALNEPDSNDAQLWLDNIWTPGGADPGNVWFGGQIPQSASDSVTTDIFEAVLAQSQSNGVVGLPAIAILDRNFIVRDLVEGYSTQGAILERARGVASVPEPSCCWLALLVVFQLRCRRKVVV